MVSISEVYFGGRHPAPYICMVTRQLPRLTKQENWQAALTFQLFYAISPLRPPHFRLRRFQFCSIPYLIFSRSSFVSRGLLSRNTVAAQEPAWIRLWGSPAVSTAMANFQEMELLMVKMVQASSSGPTSSMTPRKPNTVCSSRSSRGSATLLRKHTPAKKPPMP